MLLWEPLQAQAPEKLASLCLRKGRDHGMHDQLRFLQKRPRPQLGSKDKRGIMTSVYEFLQKLPPYWHEVSLLIQRVLGIIQENKHRPIYPGKALQDVLHTRLQTGSWQRGIRRSSDFQNITEQQLQYDLRP